MFDFFFYITTWHWKLVLFLNLLIAMIIAMIVNGPSYFDQPIGKIAGIYLLISTLIILIVGPIHSVWSRRNTKKNL